MILKYLSKEIISNIMVNYNYEKLANMLIHNYDVNVIEVQENSIIVSEDKKELLNDLGFKFEDEKLIVDDKSQVVSKYVEWKKSNNFYL
jgi:uncharacterized protein (UPF0179 family)